MPHRLVVVDGYSVLFRSFFGVPALATSQGYPTNAVYGFATVLLRLLDDPGAAAVVVVFDAPSRTFRHEADPGYKAHRLPAPDEFRQQIPLVFELVKAFNLPLLMEQGVEADDVIGAVAKLASEAGWNVSVLSGDSDTFQLINDRVDVLCPSRGGSMDRIDAATVEARYGVVPGQIPDWKALAGDRSDNIPGVPGIGPKTATTLLRQFGSLESLYSRLDEVSSPRWRDLLSQNRDAAFNSQHLTVIRTDLPVTLDLEEWKSRQPSMARLQELFRRLEFRSLLQRAPEINAAAPDLAPLDGCDYLPMAARELPAFVAANACSDDPQPVFLALAESSDEALSMAVASSPGRVRWIDDPDSKYAAAFLEDPGIPKCLHDAKDAMQRLARRGITLRGVIGDTLLASYLIHPGRGRHGLDEMARELLNVELPPPDDTGAGPNHPLMRQVDCMARLYETLLCQVQEDGMESVLQELELPLVPILAAMERRGVCVDVEILQTASAALGSQLEVLEAEIHAMAGLTFSVQSPRQLADVLYGKLQLKPGSMNRTRLSTDAHTLRGLAAQHPLPEKVLAFREVAKLKSTYADAIPKQVNQKTGRVHTTLNQAVTATGRLSSSDPNLQNIPVRTAVGRELRRAFVAPPGCVLLSVDYSQIELRILAHYAGDSELCRAFAFDEDIHALTAASVFGVGLADVTQDMRRRAKSINFGLLYGMSGFGLANDLGMTRREADSFIRQYFNRFPGVKSYLAQTLETARRLGYVTTLIGRRRLIPDINSRNHHHRQAAERAAVNTPIQGTAADMMKAAMIRVDRSLRAHRLMATMILQVHDELIFELPQAELEEVVGLVTHSMQGALPLNVPIRTDACVGPNWADMRKLDRGGKCGPTDVASDQIRREAASTPWPETLLGAQI